MKGTKTSLFLVELMVSLLLFAFCAAICIQIFNVAGRKTQRAEALSKGVFRATELAELYKSVGGDMAAVTELYGETAMVLDDGPELRIYFDKTGEIVNPSSVSSGLSDTYGVTIRQIDVGVALIMVIDRTPHYDSLSIHDSVVLFNIEVKAVA